MPSGGRRPIVKRSGSGRYSTRAILVLAFTALTAIPILAASVFYYQTERKTLMDNTVQYERQAMSDVAGDIASLYAQFDKIQYEVANQAIALKIPQINYRAYTSRDLDSIRLLENLLQSIRRTIPGVSNVYVVGFGDPGAVYSSVYSFSRERLLQKPWLGGPYANSTVWHMIPDQAADYDYPVGTHGSRARQKNVYCFVAGLMDIDMDEAFEYLIQIDITGEYMARLFERLILDERDTLLVSAADQTTVYQVNYLDNPSAARLDALRQTLERQGGEYLIDAQNIVTSITVEEAGLSITKLRAVDLSGNERKLLVQIASVALVALAASAVLGTLLASSITRPFRAIIDDTLKLMNTDAKLAHVCLESSNVDVESIALSFNALIDRVNQLIQSVVRQQVEQKNLEMQMLQSQISPHFLYNTLNSIKWLALIEEKPAIADAVVALVALLEFCLKDTDSLVTLADEVEFLREYIQLERLRYDSHVEVDFAVEPAAHSLYVPKFTLQPSVENALLHAFGDTSADPRIRVGGIVAGDALILTVEDNGKGFDVGARSLTGIGINNVNERIRLAFGEEYGQKIESVLGKGTRVTLRLPVIRTREEAPDAQSFVG